jgi:hypothetical protein
VAGAGKTGACLKTSGVMEEKLRFVFEHERQERAMTELSERDEITGQQPIANFTFSASSQIRRLVTVRRGDRG